MEYGERYVDAIGFFYYPSENVFKDEDGNIVYNIYDYVPPLVVEDFKDGKDDYSTYEVTSTFIVELYLVDDFDGGELYDNYRYAMDKYDPLDYNGPHINCLR